jgi:hypothetical protein
MRHDLEMRANGGRSLAPSAEQILKDRDGSLPVWVRALKRGHEFCSGCTRPKLYDWAGKGFIRSVSIREPGRIKGVRLFHLASILTFIERCESETNTLLAQAAAGFIRCSGALQIFRSALATMWIENQHAPVKVEAFFSR